MENLKEPQGEPSPDQPPRKTSENKRDSSKEVSEKKGKRKLRIWYILGLFLLLFLTCFIGAIIGVLIGSSPESSLPGEKVALLELEGPIISSREKGSSKRLIVSDEVVPFINEMRKRDNVRGMLIIVNSPGGSATASYEIYRAILSFREKKPVVVYIRDIAASGGYYISSAGSYIVASPTAIVGNIGAIIINLDLREMLNKLGVKPIVIKSAPHKDLLSVFRQPTPEERELLEDVIKDVADQFKADVVRGRAGKLSKEELDRIADGRIFSGRMALKYKLVDQVGTLSDAEAKLKELLKIPKDKKLKYIRFKPKTSGLSELLESLSPLSPEVELYSSPKVLYR